MDRVKLKYGSAADQPWLDHVRLSSVRFNNGGSGSCVSVDGLAFTNHHVGSTCIQQLSTGGTDYMRTGFYANTRGDEAKCPDLELKVLTGIEDVTSEVNGALKPGMSAAQAGQARRAATANIEQDCAKSTGLRCDVVPSIRARFTICTDTRVHACAPGVRARVRCRIFRR